MKSVAGSLRLDLAQYRELAAFAQFGSDLDKASQQQLSRGKRWVEILKQGAFSPVPVEKQVAIIYAAGNGYVDDVPVEDVRRFEAELYKYLENSRPEILPAIRDKKQIDDDLKGKLNDALKAFKGQFSSSLKGSKPASSDGNRNGQPAGQRPQGTPNSQVAGQVDEEARKAQNKA
jgi:F-type H+-transporting ATPase subunit alpha